MPIKTTRKKSKRQAKMGAAKDGAATNKRPKKSAGRKATKDAIKARWLHPKLRVIRNGSRIVNTLRAERSDAVRVRDEESLKTARRRDPGALPMRLAEVKRVEWANVDHPASEVAVGAFIQLAESPPALPEEVQDVATARRDNIVVSEISLDRLDEILDNPIVSGIDISQRLTFSPPLDLRIESRNVVKPSRRVSGEDVHHDGEGVLIGVIDVQGFDFAHPDFLTERGETKFYRIWDQEGQNRSAPRGFNYGSELKHQHLNAAIRASEKMGVASYLLEPQSLAAPSSHATHVASIAAGNSGVCPKAILVGVGLALSEEEVDRRRSLYDSTRLAHAVDYLFGIGQELRMPVSLNISLGTNGHAHDGTSAVSRWIDHALATPGRSVCVAAGNSGQEAGRHPSDFGFLSGRIHSSGHIPAAGLTRTIEWVVAGFGIPDLSENELELWYSMQDRFAVEIKPPDSDEWIGPVGPAEYIENRQLDDGIMVSIYNELYVPANGQNIIACYLSPLMTESGVVGVRPGTWVIRVNALEVRDGHYDAWIERDDTRPVAPFKGWAFPSFFTEGSNVDRSSVSSLACGHHVVAVANLDEANERINVSSSQGPTRDGRFKPEIAAPGTGILAANGFDDRDKKMWVRMTGTSMASPYVAGVIGLMLAVEPDLTAAQISGILRRNAQPLPGADFRWRDDAGFGRIDPDACVREAAEINRRTDKTNA